MENPSTWEVTSADTYNINLRTVSAVRPKLPFQRVYQASQLFSFLVTLWWFSLEANSGSV